MELTQHDHLAKFRRQAVQRTTECFFGLRVMHYGVAMLHLVELHGERVGTMALAPAMGRVAHDRQQPGARARRLLAAETLEILERAQAGVLHDVFRVLRVPRQVACQCVRSIQVRQHERFESRA